MQTHVTTYLLILMLSFTLIAEANTPEPQQTQTSFPSFVLPDWFKVSFLDLSEDNLEAQEDGKQLVVFFSQEFCPYCKAMVEQNLTQASIRDTFERHFDVVSLDIWGAREVYGFDGEETTEKAIAAALDVQFTPTLMFFDAKGDVTLRLNGYVSPYDMTVALEYVSQKKYTSMSIFDYLASQQRPDTTGGLNQQAFFVDSSTARQGKPYAVLFEQSACPDCDSFHQCVLSLESVQTRFAPFHTTQVDMWSSQPITTPDGRSMAARDFAKSLNIAYAPTLVLFDENGQEIIRADSQLRNFHTEALLEFASESVYLNDPSFQAYIEVRGDRLRANPSLRQGPTTRDVCPNL